MTSTTSARNFVDVATRACPRDDEFGKRDDEPFNVYTRDDEFGLRLQTLTQTLTEHFGMSRKTSTKYSLVFLSDYRCRSTQFRNALRNYHFTCRRARTSTGKRSRYKKEESQRSFDQLRCIGH